nr:photosystem I P700 apoprotein A2, chloroplastic [Tanacetum cinerariifolium]
MYRTNWGIGHGLKDILEAHKGPFTAQGHKGLYEILTTSWHAQLSFNLAMLGFLTIIVAHHMYAIPPYPYLPPDYGTQLSLFTHHMWIGGVLIVGVVAHVVIFMVKDYDPTTRFNDLLDHVLRHRDAIISHLNWACIFQGFHSLALYIHNDTMSTLGRPQDMFSDTAIQLQSKGVLFARSSCLIPDKANLVFCFPCDVLGRGGSGKEEGLRHSLRKVLLLLTGGSTISYGHRHPRPIAHAIWDPHFCQPAVEAFTRGGALGPVNIAYSGVYQWWYTISLQTNKDLYTGALSLLFISTISLIAGWLHLQPKWKPSVSWFKNAESRLNHHLSGLFGVSSLAWTGHLVHVAIPASRGEYVRWNNFLDVLPHPQGLGPLFTGQWNLYAQNPDSSSHLFGTSQGAGTAILTFLGGFHPQTQSLWLTDMAHHHLAIAFIFLIAGHMYRTNFGIGHSIKDLLDAHIPPGGAFAHGAIFFIRDYNPEQNEDNVLARMLEHKEAIISHLSWASLFLGFHTLGLYVHNDVMLAFGTPEKPILIEPIFAQWIQSAHGPGDFLVHHAIALGLHTTTLILVKGALDACGSKLMPDKKDFGSVRWPRTRRDYNLEQNEDNVLARMLEHKEAIISHLSWDNLFLGFHTLGIYVHNDVMLAFGTSEKPILIEPIFTQCIQSAHGKTSYGFDILLSSMNGLAFNAGQSIWLPGWLNAINENSNSLFLTIGPGDFLVHHAIALVRAGPQDWNSEKKECLAFPILVQVLARYKSLHFAEYRKEPLGEVPGLGSIFLGRSKLRKTVEWTTKDLLKVSPRHPKKYLKKGPAYVDGNCTYFAGKDFIDFRKVNRATVMKKHGIIDLSHVLMFFDDHQNELKRLKQALKVGFSHLVFEDHYDFGTGDHYSLRQICDQSYIQGTQDASWT